MDRKESKCVHIDVPKVCCYVKFGEGKCRDALDRLITVTGDEMIIDLDKDGRVIGIELVGDGKPCQESEM